MFIHLGGEKIIRASELIAIFDISMEKSSKISKQFINKHEKDKKIEKSVKKIVSHGCDQQIKYIIPHFLNNT